MNPLILNKIEAEQQKQSMERWLLEFFSGKKGKVIYKKSFIPDL
jgi:hypothetical protein